VKLVHAADLHVDSPLLGLERYPGAPVEQIRGATRRALENLVELCEEQRVGLLLLAGDLFDGDWRDYTTGLFFAEQMGRLKRAGTRVALVRGNHDAASQISKYLPLPDNVTELPHAAPHTEIYSDLGVAVHGQSYARRAETDDLASNYPQAVEGLLNVGLLHTAVSGRAGHEPYAPCRLETLISKGYDYWALGHVHQREVLHSDPWVVFSGNIQGRHIKELGPKGATLIEADHGRIESVTSCDLDVVRWERCSVEAQPEWDADQVVDTVAQQLGLTLSAAGDRSMVVRVVVEGSTQAHRELLADTEHWQARVRARASEFERIWVESVRLQTRPLLSAQRLATRGDALGELAQTLQHLQNEPGGLERFLPLFEDLRNKLPIEVKQGALGLRLEDRQVLLDALPDVEGLLLSTLLDAGDGQ